MATFIEQDCTIEHEGRTFEEGGAFVSDDYAVVYIGGDAGTRALGTIDRIGAGHHHVTDWHGSTIGRAFQTGTWTVGGTRVYSYSVTIFGTPPRRFNMRGQGADMMARGRRTLAS